jgi:TRAP-type mannitol/chloroaromatic compound transport system permease small subunit
MRSWLIKIVRWIDRLNAWIGSTVVTAAVLLFILVIFSNVVLRYVFNTSFVFLAELEWHLFAFVFLAGAGFTLLHDRHVRVDIFYSQMSRRRQAWVNLIGVACLLLPCCYLVLSTTIPWVVDAYKVGETSLDPGGIPARFVIKAALPLGYLLMLLQGVSLGIKSAFVLAGSPLKTED